MTYELCVRGKKVSSTREDLCLSLDIARVRVRPTVTEEGRKCSVQCFDVGSVVTQRSQGLFIERASLLIYKYKYKYKVFSWREPHC